MEKKAFRVIEDTKEARFVEIFEGILGDDEIHENIIAKFDTSGSVNIVKTTTEYPGNLTDPIKQAVQHIEMGTDDLKTLIQAFDDWNL